MVQARYCDGRSTRMQAVELAFEAGALAISGEGVERRVPFAAVTVDERLGRAARLLRLDQGDFCEVADHEGLAALLAEAGHRDAWVDRMQRHLPAVLASLLACALVLAAAYRWGLPWLADRAAERVPAAISRAITRQGLEALDKGLLQPSRLDAQRQEELAARFRRLQLPGGLHPVSPLLFRRSEALGANAFTLPDGTIVMLDGLVKLADDDQQLLAVLAHELGHAQRRHGLQLLLRSSAVGAFLSLYVGDFSQLLAAAPAALVQARYSQAFETEADDYGAAVLELNGLSPALLADILEKLVAAHPDPKSMSYLMSHPATGGRIARLRALAAARQQPAANPR